MAAVVLAAGQSRRLGRAKQTLLWEGERLLERAIRLAGEAGLHPVTVVLGARAQQIAAECDLRGAQVVLNEAWEEGMGSSVRAGVGLLARSLKERSSADGLVLMTCDQPAVTAVHLHELVQLGERSGEPVASSYAGREGAKKRCGVPAYFPDTHWGELLLLGGDAGARSLLASAPSVWLHLGEIDLDTPEALEEARAVFGVESGSRPG